MESIIIQDGLAINGLIHQPAVKNKEAIQIDSHNKVEPGLYRGKMLGWITTGANGWNKVQIIFELIDPSVKTQRVICYRNIHPLSTKGGFCGAFNFRPTQELAMELATLHPAINDFNDLQLDLLFGRVVELRVEKVIRNYAKKVRPESIQYSKVAEITGIHEDPDTNI